MDDWYNVPIFGKKKVLSTRDKGKNEECKKVEYTFES